MTTIFVSHFPEHFFFDKKISGEKKDGLSLYKTRADKATLRRRNAPRSGLGERIDRRSFRKDAKRTRSHSSSSSSSSFTKHTRAFFFAFFLSREEEERRKDARKEDRLSLSLSLFAEKPPKALSCIHSFVPKRVRTVAKSLGTRWCQLCVKVRVINYMKKNEHPKTKHR